ncbi:MAG: SH3 domain-containing protein [Elainella sp. Prado103]|nr:SH3 domain-containing protein [Elainella sp. Prado103]
MNSRTTYFYRHHRQHDRCGGQQVRRLIPLLLSLGALTGCVAPPLYDPSLETANPPLAAPLGSDDASATLTPQPSASGSASSSTSFSFPMAACGDRSSQPSETWYSVFIDGGNIDEIRSRYCGDAISATRQSSNTATVQVASFTSYARALSLAKAIGGVVEQTAQAASPPAASAAPSPERSVAPQPTPNPQPAPTPMPIQVGQTAYLNAAEAGVPINIRDQASTSASIQSTAYPGDRVQIANQVQGDDGYPWYQVKLESGITGWVRGDLIAQTPASSANRATPSPNYVRPATPAPAPGPVPTYPAPTYNANPNGNPGYAPGYIPTPHANVAPTYPPTYPPGSQVPTYPPTQPSYSQPTYPQPGVQPGYGTAPNYGTTPNVPSYSTVPGYGTPPSYGTPSGRSSTLTAQDPEATINIREFASMDSRVRYQAPPGAPVQVLGSAQDGEGYIWYQVQFSTGAGGWVRGDLLAIQ